MAVRGLGNVQWVNEWTDDKKYLQGQDFQKTEKLWIFLSEIILFNVSLSVKGLCKLYKVKDFHEKYSKFTENNLANKKKVLWF